MSTLYRKYRPQIFADLIGQNHIKITLQHEIERGEIGHAYLFCGPRGLGKTTTARLFAKAVNCEGRKDGESEPDNKCNSCKSIVAGSAIDMIEIDAASHTGVDNVRENIIENSRFTPNRSKYKIFIIDEVHMLSISAFNALLKTLEEPPEHAIFILCTTEVHKIPQTIISRCQRFDFKKVSNDDFLKRLQYIAREEKKEISDEVLKNVVLNSDGCIRDGESLLGKIFTLGEKINQEQAEIILPRSDFNKIISLLEFIVENNTTAAIELINKLVEEGVDLQIFTDNLIEFLRKVMLVKVNGNLSDFGIELDEPSEKSVEKLAKRFDYDELLSLIELFIIKRQELKSAFIGQFPLEMAVIQIIEKIICQKDDDDFDGSAGGDGGDSVKEKIKDKLSQLNPKSLKEDMPLTNVEKEELPKESAVKVDLLNKSDKLKDKSNVDFNKVKENWQIILENLLEKNYTLSALLKISQPLKCRGSVLEIGVKSNFYCERLEDNKCRKIIEEVISEAIRAKVTVQGVIKEDLEPIESEINKEPENEVKEDKKEEKLEKPTFVTPVSNKDAAQDVIDMF